eukprot:scaffold146322_cov34-Tisochrysis_lutea.AAC.2
MEPNISATQIVACNRRRIGIGDASAPCYKRPCGFTLTLQSHTVPKRTSVRGRPATLERRSDLVIHAVGDVPLNGVQPSIPKIRGSEDEVSDHYGSVEMSENATLDGLTFLL